MLPLTEGAGAAIHSEPLCAQKWRSEPMLRPRGIPFGYGPPLKVQEAPLIISDSRIRDSETSETDSDRSRIGALLYSSHGPLGGAAAEDPLSRKVHPP